MALSLGSIGNFFSRALDFSTPANSASATGSDPSNPLSYDGSQFSDEMLGGEHNPLLDSIQQTVQQVELAQSFGGDPSTSVQQLQQEVQQAQNEGVQLPPELQQAVDQILSQFGLNQAGLSPGAGQDFAGATPGSAQNGGSGGSAPASAGSNSGPDGAPSAGAGGGASVSAAAPAAADPNSWGMAGLFDQTLASEPAGLRNPDAWSQGDSAGNCSSVAVIKAATAESGNAIFQNVQKTDEGYVITTQDGRTVKLSQAELATAEKTADFDGPDSPAKAQAVVAAGVMAKNYAAEHPGLTYQQALNATNGVKDPVSNPQGNGRFPEDAAHDLGIPYSRTSAQAAVKDVKNSGGQEAAIIYNNQHAEAVTGNSQGGAKTDDYGRGVNTNGQISKNGATSQATHGVELHSRHKDQPKAA